MATMDTDEEGCRSQRMQRLEEGRLLPWRLVKHGTWVKLANKLDLHSPVSNNDWRGLAEHLGFSTEDILVLESNRDRNTIALFANYLPKKDASVNSVAKALKQMNRDDALQILLDAVPDIESRYDAEPYKSSLEAVEGEDTCTQGGCRCLRSATSLSCKSSQVSGSCSCYNHSHHHLRQCNVTSGCCCCHHLGNMHAPQCFTSPISCSSHPLHNNLHHSNMTSPPLPAHRPAVRNGTSHMSSLNYNITAQGGHSESDYKHHGGDSSDFFRPHSSHSSPSPLQHHHQHSVTEGDHLLYYQHQPKTSYSMQVHHDVNHRAQMGLPSFSSDQMEVEGVVREEPAVLHTTIARGQGLASQLNGQVLPMDVVTDFGDDTPSTSLEELSSSDSGSRLTSMPLNIVRQMSEECNSNQSFGAAGAARAVYEKSRGLDPVAAWVVDTQGAVGGNVFPSAKCTNYDSKESQSSLKKLETLSQLPSHFKPAKNYTTMMVEQKVEEGSQSQRNRVQIKSERDTNYLGQQSCNKSNYSARRPGADTFPLRVKPQPGGATVDQVRSRQPGTLTKTTSVPIDMKVEEFKKAFRHIKVFVTYANDSKQHCRQVLSLCTCLERNGFSCCVDVGPRRDSGDQQQNILEWCACKFKEADFVLVCLSSLYLQEIKEKNQMARAGKTASTSNRSASQSQLHTSHIYQLMYNEYQSTGRSSRFVPLYMEGAACDPGPAWLTSHLTYHWPRQYKDLLWMLTKPEDRIKQRSHNGMKVNGVYSG